MEVDGQVARDGLMVMAEEDSPVWESAVTFTTATDVRGEHATSTTSLLDTGSSILTISQDVAANLIKLGAKTRVGRRVAVRDAQQNIFVLDREVEVLLSISREDGEIFRLKKYFYVHDTGHDFVINKATLINEGLAVFLLGSDAGLLRKGVENCPEIDDEWLQEEASRAIVLISIEGGTGEEIERLRRDSMNSFMHELKVIESAKERRNQHASRILRYSCIKMIELMEYPEINPSFRLKDAALTLCRDFNEIFGPLPKEGPTGLEEMKIKVREDYNPRKEPLRHFAPSIQADVDKELQEHMDEGIIQPSTANIVSQVVPVAKPSNGITPRRYRICHDYVKLNEATINDEKWPLPKVEEVLTRMSKKKFFAKFDLLKGFHQLMMHKDSRHLTAFITKGGVYEYVRVPMGVKGSPAFFQRQMESIVFKDLVDVICQIYIDDIVVYADTEEELMENLRKVFDRIMKHGLRIKGVKSEIGATSIKFLGSIVDADGIRIDPSRKQAIRDMVTPTNVTTLKSFLGVAQYCMKFIERYDLLSKPLNELTKKNVKFVWTDVHQQAFEQIKESIYNSNILHHIDYSLPLVLRVDAAKTGCGGHLVQIRTVNKVDAEGKLMYDEHGQIIQEQVEETILFFSHSFSPQAAMWSTIEQECYAIFHGVTRLQEYLLGVPFTLETDHRNLLWLSKSAVPKLVRWRLRLQEFDMDIVHVPGVTQLIADGMSRCLAMSTAKYDTKHYAAVRQCHNGIVGHRGRQQLLYELRDRGLDFPLMEEMVDTVIKCCHTCQKIKGNAISASKFPLGSLMTDQPWDTLSMDYIGPISSDQYGSCYILVIIDNFSRFVELFALPNNSSDEVAKAILSIYGRYGLPKVIHSDKGTHFTANVIEALCQYFNVKKQYSLPYRPQANGLVERANKEIMQHVRALVMDKRIIDDWGIHLPIIQRIMNTMFHTAIGTTPAKIMYGSHAVDSRSLIDSVSRGKVPIDGSNDYIQALDELLEEYQSKALEIQDKIMEDHLKRQPKMPESHEFEEGQYVVIEWNVKPAGKLKPKWRGPLKVISKGETKRTYNCLDLISKKEIEVDVGSMKPFRLEKDMDPIDIAMVDRDEYRVDSIVAHRLSSNNKRGKKTFASFHYRIRWEGYGPGDDTWEEYKTIKDTEAFQLYSRDNQIVSV